MGSERKFYLREWRIYRGLTQEELGEKIGVTKGRISEFERGEEKGGRRYNETVLEQLSDALNCEPWQILGQDPSEAAEPDNSESAELVSIFTHMPKAKRKTLLDVAKVMDDQDRQKG